MPYLLLILSPVALAAIQGLLIILKLTGEFTVGLRIDPPALLFRLWVHCDRTADLAFHPVHVMNEVMPLPYLTKTDFKNAFECSTKLYYRKNSYPTTLEENDYMKFLSDSGFMIEFIAKAQFPQGVDLTGERDPQAAFEKTRELLLKTEDVVVFEAAALAGKCYARINILRREENTLHLIEKFRRFRATWPTTDR